jgi:hypothetical protein
MAALRNISDCSNSRALQSRLLKFCVKLHWMALDTLEIDFTSGASEPKFFNKTSFLHS